MEDKRSLLGKAKDKVKEKADEQRQAHAARSEEQRQLAEAQAASNKQQRDFMLDKGELYEYQVLQIRQTLIGDKIKTDGLQDMINTQAQTGWRLKTITETSVGGRVGPGGVSGLIVTFERRLFA